MYVKPSKVELVCQHCNKKYLTHPCRVRRGNARFCSIDCHYKSRMDIVARFSKYVGGKDQNGCIEWIGAKHSNGYGDFTHPSTGRSAHRAAWFIANGPIPKGMVVRHKCDNYSCVNHEHLEIGTHADNSRDMVSRNRQAKGERNGFAKLTDEKVNAAREYHKKTKCRHIEIANMLGVTRSCASNILARKSWKHV